MPDDVVEIVHDVRAPLGVASGYLTMLTDGTFGPPPEQWNAPLEVLSMKLEEARVLIDEILTLRRIDASELRADACVDLTEVAQTAAQRARPRAHLLQGSVEVDAGAAGSTVAMGDQARTLRILDNLINNALLYSGDDRRVVVRVESDAELQVAVENSGAGIPARVRRHLFEPFSRDDRSAEIGSGLGLSISRRLARQMGGDLTLDDHPGTVGSRFVLHMRSLDERQCVEGSTA